MGNAEEILSELKTLTEGMSEGIAAEAGMAQSYLSEFLNKKKGKTFRRLFAIADACGKK